MTRANVCLLSVLLLTIGPLSAVNGADLAAEAKRAAEVRKKLEATISFNGFDDPDLKLEDALAFLSQSFDIPFEINEQAFKNEMIENVAEKPLGRSVPKMTNVPLEKALRRILDRIPTTTGTIFVVRGGVVEITTRKAASPFSWEQAPDVSFAFEKRELKDALQEIADATGVNIVLDARAAEKGKTLVSATVRDVGVDTAVQLLANMADLTTMPVENVIYVTTRANAKLLRAELLHMDPEHFPESKPNLKDQ